jgi:predicted phage tail protein
MTTFFLHGRLGSTIGKEFRLSVKSIGEGLRAIECITHKLYEYLLEGDKRGIGYKVMVGSKDYLTHESELCHELTEVSEIHLYPVVQGSGNNNGLFQILIGVVMVLAEVYTAGGSLAAMGTSGAWSAAFTGGGMTGFFAAMGTSMALGGVAQLIAGQPQAGGQIKATDQNASYLFNGAVNTTRQGGPIPIGYGEMVVGSQVIALAIRAERVASDTGSGTVDSTGGTNEVAPGGAGGSGVSPYPVGFPGILPVDWVRLPEPNPIPKDGLL